MSENSLPLSETPIPREDVHQIFTDNGCRRTGKQLELHEEWETSKGDLILIPHLEKMVPADFVYLHLKKMGIDPSQSDQYRPIIFRG